MHRAPLVLTAALALVAGAAVAQPVRRGDTNADGRLSLTEFTALQGQRMMRLDGDGDGRVSLAEWSAQRRGANAAARDPAAAFARLDANRDGALDKVEIDAQLSRRFARQDADKDGQLAAGEQRAPMAQRRAAGKGAAATP